MSLDIATEAPLSQREIESALRLHFSRHNARVVLLAALTLAAAAVLWAALYLLAQWLTLLASVAISGEDTPVPRAFPATFAAVAAGLLGCAWLDRRLTPDERARNEKTAREILTDFVLAIPRVTLAAWGTLTAWQRLSRTDLALAAALIEQLATLHRMPLHAAGIEIPDAAAREKILFALQLTEVIDVRRNDRGFWIALHPPHAGEIARFPR